METWLCYKDESVPSEPQLGGAELGTRGTGQGSQHLHEEELYRLIILCCEEKFLIPTRGINQKGLLRKIP